MRNLVVVDQFNIKGIVVFKAENDAPICPYRHRPQPLQITLKLVQTIAREIESLRRRGGIEKRKDSFHRFQQIGAYPASVVARIEPLQAPMFEALDHLRQIVK